MPRSPTTRVSPHEFNVEPKPAPTRTPVRAAPEASDVSGDGDDAASLWARVLAAAGDRPSAQARLDSMTLVRVEGSTAFVRPVSAAHASRVRAGVAWIEERLSEASGRKMRVRVESPDETEDGASGAESSSPALDETTLRREASSNTLVQAAMDLFQAKLIRIEDAPARGAASDIEDNDSGDEP